MRTERRWAPAARISRPSVMALRAPVSVSYAWEAQYEGLRFPSKRTTDLEITPRARSRACVVDRVAGAPGTAGECAPGAQLPRGRVLSNNDC